MIKRLYIDNFRCFSGFTITFQPFTFLMGLNGHGKTTVFEIIHRLQQLISGINDVNYLFPYSDITRWDNRNIQSFEFDLLENTDIYNYKVVIEHNIERSERARILNEHLLFNGKPLFVFTEGNAQLYNDRFQAGPEVLFDWTRSGLSAIWPRKDNLLLSTFKDRISGITMLRPNPFSIVGDSNQETSFLMPDSGNFASWWRHIAQAQTSDIVDFTTSLRDIIPGFYSLDLIQYGDDVRSLRARFKNGNELSYKFSELSEGQRMMFVLYGMLFGLRNKKMLLFLDEPENFLSLQEIQPLLTKMEDDVTDGAFPQIAIISHHPEIINSLATQNGLWLERAPLGPTRVLPYREISSTDLLPAEEVARGWTRNN